jgi:hypothetical protein
MFTRINAKSITTFFSLLHISPIFRFQFTQLPPIYYLSYFPLHIARREKEKKKERKKKRRDLHLARRRILLEKKTTFSRLSNKTICKSRQPIFQNKTIMHGKKN